MTVAHSPLLNSLPCIFVLQVLRDIPLKILYTLHAIPSLFQKYPVII